MDSLCLGGKGSLFKAAVSTPIERVLERRTVIELQEIRDSEEKAFVMALLVNNLVEYVERHGGSRELRHVTVIEEAHELLPDISTEKGYPEAADPGSAWSISSPRCWPPSGPTARGSLS